MSLSSISIQRPVLATVFSIIIILFGVIGYSYLGVREYPGVDAPVVSVTTSYTGANADIIESQITEPLEEAINSVAGIENLSSSSSSGRSSVRIEFALGTDMDNAANDVRDKVSSALRNLPSDADPPVVAKEDADAETILSITVQSSKRNLMELTDIGNNMFKERLQTIPGVSSIRIWGEKKYAMRLTFDPARLSAYRLTPLDVKEALNRQNVELPSGLIEGYRTELIIRTFGRLRTEEEFNELIIATGKDGSIVRFKDIGNAQLGAEDERTILRGNGGIQMIGVAIQPQPGANYIEIVDAVYREVNRIKDDLPGDITVGVAQDTTISIRKAITEVKETILIAFGLVVIVIFFFLRDWRTTLIPVVTIPVSLTGTFFIMYIFGFSVNILTLLGVVLATGLVVDDAIVVMENIYVKVEAGMNPVQAAFKGSKEIVFAIISTTITLVSVFLPVIFLQGLTGRLFREFGVVVAGAVFISAFLSLSLTPMMSAKLLRKKHSANKISLGIERFLRAAIAGYKSSLQRFFGFRRAAIILMAVSISIIGVVGYIIPSELAPLEDKSRIRILSTAPEGTAYDLMDEYQKIMIGIADTLQEKESILAITAGSRRSVNSSFVRITLLPASERKRSQMEIAGHLSQVLKKHNFARSYVVQEQTISAGRGKSSLPVQFVIQASSIDKLKAVIPAFMERAEKDPAFETVNLNLKFNKPELNVEIDRSKASEMGVSVADIAQTLQLYFGGQRFGYFMKDGKQYYVIGQAERTERDDPVDLQKVTVRNSSGQMVALDNLVKTSLQSNPPELYRFNRYISATVSAAPAPGFTIGDGIGAMENIADELLDESYSTSLDGASKEFSESSDSLLFAFLLSIILIYLALAAQFESFRDPLTILLTVPLAIAGALLSLCIFGHTLNIFSEIGMIVLVGIVTKNGILIVEFANQRREQGLSIAEAAMDAAVQRFRPILMTSLATILGAVPIALALGEAATSRIPMGVAIIGGLIFSLILTLYVIPVLYTFIASKKERVYSVEEDEKKEMVYLFEEAKA